MTFKRKLNGWMAAALAALAAAVAVPLLAQDGDRPEAPAEAPAAGGSAFLVSDIDVDVVAGSAEAARVAAFREAARQAWPQLYARMTGVAASGAPKLPDSAIEGMVSGVEVQSEHFSDKRYVGKLGVVFDRVRAGERLPANARVLQSAPMLLLPVLADGGVTSVYEGRSPWLQAWSRFGTDSSPISYVRAGGSASDAMLLTGWQARRDNRGLWRSILSRYGAENVLVAEAWLDRTYPGGPIVGTFLARHGPDSAVLTRFRLRAGAAGELDAMLDTAVRRIDSAYARALQSGVLRADPTLTLALEPVSVSPLLDPAESLGSMGTTVSVATPDAASWNAIEAALGGVPEVDGVTLLGLSIGGMSQVRINHTVDYAMLRYALDQRGWRLDGSQLRRRAEGEAPLPRPAVALPSLPVADDAVTESDGPRDLMPSENER
ncbi:heavy-metal-associated domain-containing protein [Sphingosinicella sp.]|uniref:heavy-metal-associated domain-containing protein n=1 Tax=Sphingosinicella sp. TaxID=1917971 RepID=UPI0035AF3A03